MDRLSPNSGFSQSGPTSSVVKLRYRVPLDVMVAPIGTVLLPEDRRGTVAAGRSTPLAKTEVLIAALQ